MGILICTTAWRRGGKSSFGGGDSQSTTDHYVKLNWETDLEKSSFGGGDSQSTTDAHCWTPGWQVNWASGLVMGLEKAVLTNRE